MKMYHTAPMVEGANMDFKLTLLEIALSWRLILSEIGIWKKTPKHYCDYISCHERNEKKEIWKIM